MGYAFVGNCIQSREHGAVTQCLPCEPSGGRRGWGGAGDSTHIALPGDKSPWTTPA